MRDFNPGHRDSTRENATGSQERLGALECEAKTVPELQVMS